MSENLIEMIKPSGTHVYVNDDSLKTALKIGWKKSNDKSVEPPKQKRTK